MLDVCKVSGTEGVKDGVSLSMMSALKYWSQGPSLVVVVISMLLSKVSHITANWWDILKPLKIAPSSWQYHTLTNNNILIHSWAWAKEYF